MSKALNLRIKKLSQLNPLISISVIIFEWILIALSIAIHLKYSNPFVYFAVWVVISTRLYALYSLLHDGIHFLLVTNRKLNDYIAKFFLAWPLFVSFSEMRKNHFDHHKYLKTNKDPEFQHTTYKEFQFPHSKFELLIIFIKDITGVNFMYYRFIRLIKDFKLLVGIESVNQNETSRCEILIRYVVFILVFALLLIAGYLKFILLYWLIPYATLYQALNRFRLFTEHFNIDSDKNHDTRTVDATFIEKFFLAPYNLGYHTEHHLFPFIPFYRLSQLHQLLISTPDYRDKIYTEHSYRGVIKSCMYNSK